MFRLFPENFFSDKKYQCVFTMFFVKEAKLFFLPINNCSLCLLFSFVSFFFFLFFSFFFFFFSQMVSSRH